MDKPIIIPSPENINAYVLAQPGTRSPETNMKSTSRSVIQSSLAFATVLASYPLLYILTPLLYIIHFMVSGGLIKSNNKPTSWDATVMNRQSLERVIGINHKCWKHGKIKGTKASLHPSTSEMALSLPKGLEHAQPNAPPDHFSSTPSNSNLANC